jgi:alkylmercury lyase
MKTNDFEHVARAVLALFSPLGETEQRLSLALYRLLARGAPVSNGALASAVEMQLPEVERVLATWPALYRDAAGDVIGYAGLTVREAKHRMRVAGRTLYAWCAWDTLFLPALLDASAQVESRCAVTGERISFTIHPERIEQGSKPPSISLVAPDRDKAWADVVHHFCSYVQFLADERAASAWLTKNAEAHIATLEQAWELGRRRNELSYSAREQ